MVYWQKKHISEINSFLVLH